MERDRRKLEKEDFLTSVLDMCQAHVKWAHLYKKHKSFVFVSEKETLANLMLITMLKIKLSLINQGFH